MGKIQVKVKQVNKEIKNNKIHRVSNDNLITLYQGRRNYIRKKFNQLVKTSRHMIIMCESLDGSKNMYTTMNDFELFYNLEQAKKAIL